MDHCCETKADDPALQRENQARILRIVLAINVLMFLVEIGAGLFAASTALLADSLDMLGDAFVYGLTLYALHRSVRWRASAALTKGIVMAATTSICARPGSAPVTTCLPTAAYCWPPAAWPSPAAPDRTS